MRVRAIKNLNQLSPADIYSTVSEGLQLILENADNLIQDAHLLLERASNKNGVWVLRGIAEEEAAKFLILIDAIRCPKEPKRFSDHLQNFNEHVAKGIYAEYYNWKPATFGEIFRYIDHYRAEHYLDGPEGVEWIFRNSINQSREEMMYVDYVEDDDGSRWQKPDPIRMRGGKMHSAELERGALKVSQALKATGCTTPESLSFMSEFWNKIEMIKELHWQDLRKLNITFFKGMEEKGLLRSDPKYLVDHWLFPIYSLDLSMKKISKSELREIQERWNP